MEFTRIIRKTIIENRKMFCELQLNEEKNAGTKRFKGAVRKVQVARKISIANQLVNKVSKDIQDREEYGSTLLLFVVKGRQSVPRYGKYL